MMVHQTKCSVDIILISIVFILKLLPKCVILYEVIRGSAQLPCQSVICPLLHHFFMEIKNYAWIQKSPINDISWCSNLLAIYPQTEGGR
jgi:hypothetical protein